VAAPRFADWGPGVAICGAKYYRGVLAFIIPCYNILHYNETAGGVKTDYAASALQHLDLM